MSLSTILFVLGPMWWLFFEVMRGRNKSYGRARLVYQFVGGWGAVLILAGAVVCGATAASHKVHTRPSSPGTQAPDALIGRG